MRIYFSLMGNYSRDCILRNVFYMFVGAKTPPRSKTPPTPVPEPPKDGESNSRPNSGILKSPKRQGSAASRKSSGKFVCDLLTISDY